MSDPLLDMPDPPHSNGHIIMISLLVVFLPVALALPVCKLKSANLIFQNGIYISLCISAPTCKNTHCSSNGVYIAVFCCFLLFF